jgi:hypothetical protein
MYGRMVRDETRRGQAQRETDAPADRLPVTAGDNGARDDA